LKIKNSITKKLSLWAFILIIATFLSILTIYAYGALFSHERYWYGTIRNVNLSEIKLISGLLNNEVDHAVLNSNSQLLHKIFSPVLGKIYIRIKHDKREVFNNNKFNYLVENDLYIHNKNTAEGLIVYTFGVYKPPSWNYQFLKWIKDIGNWFTYRHDFITIPFLFFFGIWSLALIAIVWRYKARLESDRLFHILETFDEIREDSEKSK